MFLQFAKFPYAMHTKFMTTDEKNFTPAHKLNLFAIKSIFRAFFMVYAPRYVQCIVRVSTNIRTYCNNKWNLKKSSKKIAFPINSTAFHPSPLTRRCEQWNAKFHFSMIFFYCIWTLKIAFSSFLFYFLLMTAVFVASAVNLCIFFLHSRITASDKATNSDNLISLILTREPKVPKRKL